MKTTVQFNALQTEFLPLTSENQLANIRQCVTTVGVHITEAYPRMFFCHTVDWWDR